MNIKMEFFSYDSLKILQSAHKIAHEMRFSDVGSDHLLLAFCEKNDFLKQLNLDSLDLKFEIYKLIGFGTSEKPPASYTPKTKSIIDNSLDEVFSFKEGLVEPIHIFISLLKEKNCVSHAVFEDLSLNTDNLIEFCYELLKKELIF